MELLILVFLHPEKLSAIDIEGKQIKHFVSAAELQQFCRTHHVTDYYIERVTLDLSGF
jgi:hypothetical protein